MVGLQADPIAIPVVVVHSAVVVVVVNPAVKICSSPMLSIQISSALDPLNCSLTWIWATPTAAQLTSRMKRPRRLTYKVAFYCTTRVSRSIATGDR